MALLTIFKKILERSLPELAALLLEQLSASLWAVRLRRRAARKRLHAQLAKARAAKARRAEAQPNAERTADQEKQA